MDERFHMPVGARVYVSVMWLLIVGPVVNAVRHEPTQTTKASTARTVWDGIFTAPQAQRGRIAYTRSCASCHAEDLRGNSTAPSLVEESFAFLWDDMSVGDLFVRTRTLMPSDRPNSLSSESYRDIVAYLLESNKFPPGDNELDTNVEALRQILITTKRP